MSVVITPEWVQVAAEDLAGLRAAISDASHSVAGFTTNIAPAAADEVSNAIAALFDDLGAEYQAISARTQAFHAEFARALGAGAGAYLGSEGAIAELLLANAATAAPAASILDGLTFGLGNPGGPLGAVGALVSGGGLLGGLGLPSLLPGVFAPAPGATPPSLAAITGPYEALFTNTINNLQSLGNGLAANPFPFLRQFITNQAGYGNIIATSLATAGQHLSAGFGAGQILTDLAPIAAIPGRIGQNAFNVFATLTDFSYSIGANLDPLQVGAAFFGLPIALGIDAIGSPITTGSALASVASAFSSAVQRGDAFGAAVAVLTAPAVVTNGFLNGQVMLSLGLPGVNLPLVGNVGSITVPVTASIPVGGILTPLSVNTLMVNPLLTTPPLVSVPLGGTPTGGILPGLLLYAPQRLAEAIGAAPLPNPLLPTPQVVLPGLPVVPGLPSVGDLLPGLPALPDLGSVLAGLGGLGLPTLPSLPALPGLPPLLP